MFCEKCGSRLVDGEPFCGNCGAPAGAPPQNAAATTVQPPVSAAPAAEAVSDYAPSFEPKQPKPKMSKKKKKAIIISCVAVVAAVGIFLAIAFATGLFKSDKDKFEDTVMSTTGNTLGKVREVIHSDFIQDGGSFTLEVEPGPMLSSIESYTKVDLSWVESVSLDVTTDNTGGRTAASAVLNLNGQKITDLNLQIDPDSGKILVGADGLSDKYGEIDLSALGDFGKSFESMETVLSELDEYTETMDDMLGLVEKYVEKLVDAIDDVDRSSGSINANGVSQDCTTYTIDITMGTVINVEKTMIEAMLNDGDFKDVMRTTFEMQTSSYGYDFDFDEYYEMFRKQMEYSLEQLDMSAQYVDKDMSLGTIVIYADGDDVIGIRVKTNASAMMPDSIEFFFGLARSGGRFGVELSYNGTPYIVGGGSKSGDALTGDIVISDGDYELATIKLIDFDLDDMTGGIEISLPRDTWKKLVGSDMASALANFSLRINLGGSGTSFDLLAGGVSALKVTATRREKQSIALDENVTSTDIQSWMKSLSPDTLVSRLRSAGVPDQYVRVITNYLQSAFSGSSRYRY